MNLRSGRRLFRRVHILPSLLTLGNFACGFFSIVLCMGALLQAERIREAERNAAHGVLTPPPVSHVPDVLAAAAATATTPTTTTMPTTTTGTLSQAKPAGETAVRDLLIFSGERRESNRAAVLFHWACLFVFFGMLFDVLDGKVARHIGAASAFGVELDSLADCITFGVVPPILVNTLWMAYMPSYASWWGLALVSGVVFAICAVLRLARYNIQSGAADKNIFSGLPSPAAAGCVVSAIFLFQGDYPLVASLCDWLSGLTGGHYGPLQIKANILALFLLLPGLLMVTTFPFTHLANRYLAGRRPFPVLVTAVLLLALVFYEPRPMLFLIFNGYMALGVALAARKKWSGAATKSGDETHPPS